MKVSDRLSLFILSITLVVFSIFLIITGTGFFQSEITQGIQQIYYNQDIRTVTLIIGLFLLILSLYILSKSLYKKEITPVFHQKNDNGEIRITVDTIENLASKVASKVKGVNQLKVKVRSEEAGSITILTKVFVDGETPIPQITENIQMNVKENVERITGLTIEQIHVVVSNIAQANVKKARVE